MMLTGPEIIKQVEAGNITIRPFETANVGPNSVDLRLGNTLRVYLDEALDSAVQNETMPITMDRTGYVLEPGELYLGHTIERAGSTVYVPKLEGRSSLARLGLQVHMTAGFGDVGFVGQWTLEMTVQKPLKVYPGARICQVCFHEVVGERRLYAGKYLNQQGPVASRSHRDFFFPEK